MKETDLTLDYSIKSVEDRTKKVNYIIENTPKNKLTPLYLEKLSNYICYLDDKSKYILTDNHNVTINKRETSLEALEQTLSEKSSNIHNFITNDKNILFTLKSEINEDEEYLKDINKSIADTKEQLTTATGKKRFILKKQLIELYQNRYIIYNAYTKPIQCLNKHKFLECGEKISLSEKIYVDDNGSIVDNNIISLYNKDHISLLLCHYKQIYQKLFNVINSDIKLLVEEFAEILDNTLEKHPLYRTIVELKTADFTNEQIQHELRRKYSTCYSKEYISMLWRHKIPTMVAENASKKFLNHYFTFVEKGKWKKCSQCGEIKLAHSLFYCRNRASKDGFYSICKECRSIKHKMKEGG